MPRRSAFAAALLLGAVALPAEVRAGAMLKGYPDVIVCSAGQLEVFVYLSRVMPSGEVIYRGHGEGGVLRVDTEGVLRRPGENDCNGVTLEDKRKAGQTRDFGG